MVHYFCLFGDFYAKVSLIWYLMLIILLIYFYVFEEQFP
jgi:hypothetical protein